MSDKKSLVPIERIERMIIFIRGQKVMLDSDLAELYGVETKVLNQAVKRNIERFPEDFMFQLTGEEWEVLRCHFGTSNKPADLRSQNVTSKDGRGGRRYPPYVFTEHGAVMLANVIRSDTAVNASIQVVRAFIRLREMLVSNKELARRLDELEKNYDAQFKVVFQAIRGLMQPAEKERRRIGFRSSDK
jgi:phage regulator Rha-like protein